MKVKLGSLKDQNHFSDVREIFTLGQLKGKSVHGQVNVKVKGQ